MLDMGGQIMKYSDLVEDRPLLGHCRIASWEFHCRMLYLGIEELVAGTC